MRLFNLAPGCLLKSSRVKRIHERRFAWSCVLASILMEYTHARGYMRAWCCLLNSEAKWLRARVLPVPRSGGLYNCNNYFAGERREPRRAAVCVFILYSFLSQDSNENRVAPLPAFREMNCAWLYASQVGYEKRKSRIFFGGGGGKTQIP